MQLVANNLEVEKNLEAVLEDGVVRGFYRGGVQREVPITVVLVHGGRSVATATCDDKAAFIISVPQEFVQSAKPLTLRLATHDVNSSDDLATGDNQDPSIIGRSELSPASVVAHLDALLENGLLEGWSWWPESAEHRVKLLVIVDGSQVGITLADIPRADLASAKIGDGAHAFSYLVPWSALQNKSRVTIGVAAEGDPNTILSTRTFHRKLAATIDERIRSLEQEVRLLRSRLKTVDDHNRHLKTWVSQVLGTMGGFFDQMSRVSLDTSFPEFGANSSGLIVNTSSDLEPIVLLAPAEPTFTLIISADGNLEQVHSCLKCLKQAGVDTYSGIVILDYGVFGDVSNIPIIAPGIRYWRVQPGQSQVEAINLILQSSQRQFVCIFSSAVQFSTSWIEGSIGAFDLNPRCLVIAPKLVRPDSTIEASALTLSAGGRFTGFGQAELEFDPKVDTSAAVVAACSHAIMIRASAFARIGKFSQSFSNPAEATLDFCIRCWAEGYEVLYQPTIRLGWDESACPALETHEPIDPSINEIFRRTWQAALRPAWPVKVGNALILVASWEQGTEPAGIAANVSTLLKLQYTVSVLAVDGLLVEPTLEHQLRAVGATILRPPFCGSPLEELEKAQGQYEIIFLTSAAARFITPKQIRERAPKATILLDVDGILASAVPNEDQPTSLDELTHQLEAVDFPITVIKSHFDLLYSSGGSRNIRQIGGRFPSAFSGRSGVVILPSKYVEVTEQSRSWFCRAILPLLLGHDNSILCHATGAGEGFGGTSLDSVIEHNPASVTPEFLKQFRLAIAPMQLELLDPAYRTACRDADLPIVCPVASLSRSVTYEHANMLEGTDEELTRQILRLYSDEQAWQILATNIEGEPALTHDAALVWLTEFYSKLLAANKKTEKLPSKLPQKSILKV